MHPADKKPKNAPAQAPEEEEQQPAELEQATMLGMSLDDLASSTAKGLTPPGGADEGEIDPSLDGQATMMLDRDPLPVQKRPSLKLKRPSKQIPAVAPEPRPVEEPDEAPDPSATMMLGAEALPIQKRPSVKLKRPSKQIPAVDAPAPESQAEEPEDAPDPNATMMLLGDSLPEETTKAPRSAAQSAGAFSRQQAREEKEKLRTSKIISTKGIADPGATANVTAPARGKWLVPTVAFALIAVVVIVAGAVTRERLPVEQLQVLYPYGFEGARGPYGQIAPGADEVTFTYAGSVDCNSHAECLRYKFQAGNFSGAMVVGREPNGTWSRVADEGLPFPATAPKQEQ